MASRSNTVEGDAVGVAETHTCVLRPEYPHHTDQEPGVTVSHPRRGERNKSQA
jgi:hypothetical protein